MEKLSGPFAELHNMGVKTAPGLLKIVDSSNSGALNFENLREFLLDSGLLPYNAEIIGILRRVDRDGDGIISLKELDQFLTRFTTYDEEISRAERHLKRLSASKSKNGDLDFSMRKSSLKSTLRDVTDRANHSLTYFRRNSGSKKKTLAFRTPEKPPLHTPSKNRKLI